jgi:hypothetical protein
LGGISALPELRRLRPCSVRPNGKELTERNRCALRPAIRGGCGRYITRAHKRYATRTKLYQEIVALLHEREPEGVSANRAAGFGT